LSRQRLLLIAAAILAVAGFVAALAWWESRYPLKYLDERRCGAAQAYSKTGRFRRDLSPGEVAGLCGILRAAREVGEVDGPTSVAIEMRTVDYGRLVVEDFAGPGGRVTVLADQPGEKRVTVRSDALGAILAGLAGEADRNK
jgi:hypothetical protein